MARVMSFLDATALFKDIAEKSIHIKDYVGPSITELKDKMSSVDGIQSPFLCLFGYRGALQGNTQRTANNKSLAFSILYSGIDSMNFYGQDEAVSSAETIGLKVISRINILSKMPDIPWLYNNFDSNSVRYDQLRGEEAEGFYGMEFFFDLKIQEPLIVDPEDWSDGGIFCTP